MLGCHLGSCLLPGVENIVETSTDLGRNQASLIFETELGRL